MPRGLADKTRHLLFAAYDVMERIQPATCRACAYQLFNAKLIPDMSERSVGRVEYVLLRGRELGIIPWAWVVDENRAIERQASWGDPVDYAEAVKASYRRDRWKDQPEHLLLVSEMGTMRGVLKPVLDDYGVGLLVVHGYSSATAVMQLAKLSQGGKPLVILYVGDHDPSGRHMSDADLPDRIFRYGGHAPVRRVALTDADCTDALPWFPAASKAKDSRYRWFLGKYGPRCWELDAINPNVLRDRIAGTIAEYIDWDAWQRADVAEEAELESLSGVMSAWQGLFSGKPKNTEVA